ncbi:MAG: DUF368 domain-containing protein [Erysipelotrichaceae bacterium]|nr:DUF368 domain-containing protein [Erysipelotrichaceae bacterium]
MNIQEFLKGIIIGIAKIIPGFSGAVLMISFNLYDRAIHAITCFMEKPKKNFLFLANLSLGVIIGIVLFSKVISYFLAEYYLYTTMLFLGLIIGGIPIIFTKITKQKMNYILILVSFAIMTFVSIVSPMNHYILKHNILDIILFFFAGVLEAVGTVLPGVSSTALLMLIGVYDSYIVTLSNILNFSLLRETLYFFLPFTVGLLVGIMLLTILVNFLFKNYRAQTFSFILGISLSTVFLLIVRLISYVNSTMDFVCSFFLLIIGYILTNKLT